MSFRFDPICDRLDSYIGIEIPKGLTLYRMADSIDVLALQSSDYSFVRRFSLTKILKRIQLIHWIDLRSNRIRITHSNIFRGIIAELNFQKNYIMIIAFQRRTVIMRQIICFDIRFFSAIICWEWPRSVIETSLCPNWFWPKASRHKCVFRIIFIRES